MTTKTFICKEGASNYYLVSDGQGGFLNPPGDSEHSFSIQEFRGSHNVGSCSLRYAIECDWYPLQVKHAARQCINKHKGNTQDETWIASVYNYFRKCYSPDGINRNVSDCIITTEFSKYPPEWHLAYLFIKQFDSEHAPRLDLIANDPGYGSWSKGK